MSITILQDRFVHSGVELINWCLFVKVLRKETSDNTIPILFKKRMKALYYYVYVYIISFYALVCIPMINQTTMNEHV